MKFEVNTHKIRFLLASLATAFFYYLFSFKICNPYFTSWLYSKDGSIYAGGLSFFLNEPWHFPIGKIIGYSYPFGTSLVYTDVPSWLALITKVLHFSANSVQFYGIWILLSFILQAIVGYELILSFSKEGNRSQWNAFFGALIFLILPSFLFRMFENTRHYSLVAHFLVMLVLIRLVNDFKAKKINRFIWTAILIFTFGIHLYFSAIIFLLWAGLEIHQAHLEEELKHPQTWLKLFALGTGSLFICEALGYFTISIQNSSREGGFGSFSMNLFSFFNSEGFSNLLLKLPTRSLEQREGVAYLGLGIFSLILLLFSQAKSRKIMKSELMSTFWTPLGLTTVFIFLFSLSPRITFFGITVPDGVGYGIYAILFYIFYRKIIKTEHPEAKAIALVCATLLFYFYFGLAFRSSGRFSWCLTYALIAYLIRFSSPRWVLPLVVLVQIADLAPLINGIREENHKIYELTAKLPEQSEQWSGILDEIKQIKVVTPTSVDQPALTYFAVQRSIPVGPLATARKNKLKEAQFEEEVREKLLLGILEPNVLYVIGDGQFWNQLVMILKNRNDISKFELNNFKALRIAKVDLNQK